MSRNSQVAKTQQQQISASQAQGQQMRRIEEREVNASASAQGGLNLNIFGAISGIFSGKSKKTTDTAADGSSHSVEHRHGTGRAKGVGGGTLDVVAQGEARSQERQRLIEERMAVDQSTKAKAVGVVDHLGIEAPSGKK